MDFFNWITEFVCGLGILMATSWLMNRDWWANRAYLLATYLLLFSLVFLEQNLYWTTFFIGNPHLLLITDPIALLLAPVLFFYTIGKDQKVGLRSQLLHLVPFLLVLIVYLPVYMLNGIAKIELLKNTIWEGRGINEFRFILFRLLLFVQVVGYGYYLSGKANVKGLRRLFALFRTPLDQLLWVSFFSYGFFRAIWLVVTLDNNYHYVSIVDSSIRLLTTLLILVLFMYVFNHVKLVTKTTSYANSIIDSKESQRLTRQLDALMQTTQPYLNRNLRMIEIASRLDVSEHKLSQLLNVHMGINFFEYINRYRVERARELLNNPEYDRFTIEAIAKECGFNSKSTFNEAFRKIAGITPSGFKKSSSAK